LRGFSGTGPTVLIGKVSHGIYLFHIAVAGVVFHVFPVDGSSDIPVVRGLL